MPKRDVVFAAGGACRAAHNTQPSTQSRRALRSRDPTRPTNSRTGLACDLTKIGQPSWPARAQPITAGLLAARGKHTNTRVKERTLLHVFYVCLTAVGTTALCLAGGRERSWLSCQGFTIDRCPPQKAILLLLLLFGHASLASYAHRAVYAGRWHESLRSTSLPCL